MPIPSPRRGGGLGWGGSSTRFGARTLRTLPRAEPVATVTSRAVQSTLSSPDFDPVPGKPRMPTADPVSVWISQLQPSRGAAPAVPVSYPGRVTRRAVRLRPRILRGEGARP